MLPNVLPEARIKLCRQGAGDSVIIIENLPKEYLYRRMYKTVPMINKDTGKGSEHTQNTKEWVDAPHEKLTMSQTGDGFVHFELRNPEVQDMYKRILNYVEASLPRGEIIPKAVPYASMPGHPMSPPISIDQIPRVTLPVSSPPSGQKPVEAGTPSSLPKDPAVLKAQRERAAHARAAKKAK